MKQKWLSGSGLIKIYRCCVFFVFCFVSVSGTLKRQICEQKLGRPRNIIILHLLQFVKILIMVSSSILLMYGLLSLCSISESLPGTFPKCNPHCFPLVFTGSSPFLAPLGDPLVSLSLHCPGQVISLLIILINSIQPSAILLFLVVVH